MRRGECNHEIFAEKMRHCLPIGGYVCDYEAARLYAIWSPLPSQGEGRVRVYSNHPCMTKPTPTFILSPCAGREVNKIGRAKHFSCSPAVFALKRLVNLPKIFF